MGSHHNLAQWYLCAGVCRLAIMPFIRQGVIDQEPQKPTTKRQSNAKKKQF